jgi:hypothetical protein
MVYIDAIRLKWTAQINCKGQVGRLLLCFPDNIINYTTRTTDSYFASPSIKKKKKDTYNIDTQLLGIKIK